MTAALKEHAESLFLELLSAPPAEWSALLDTRCKDDAPLRAEVESLLRAHHDAGSFLDHQELLALTPALYEKQPEPALAAGTRIGEYAIERLIGAGGMGVVYLARQERPRRTVAIKILNSFTVGHSLVRRFEREAELLGRLQHPGIAQIFEAGSATISGTGERRPFIAMEHVEGATLTDYCTAKRLAPPEILELVARVCDAVQHAHLRGVIHRDLKPANILVTEEGRPKILDFGVARATAQELQPITLQTGVGQIIGTLAYMSPEQVRADPSEIDTRADVYAIGVLLYELLTGAHPLDLSTRSVPDAIRSIQNDDPPRLGSINREFRGELETIVSTALEKDKARRYQSADALAHDLRSFIKGEPIHAKADSALYVLRKSIVRYRHPAAAAIVVLLAIVGYTIDASIQSRRNASLARAEREARLLADSARDLARTNAENLRANLYVSAIGFAQAAQAGSDIGRVRRLLASCPEDLRGWEWRYLASICDTSSAVMPLTPPISITFASPKGDVIATLALAEPLRMLETSTGRVFREQWLSLAPLSACRFTPDSGLVVAMDSLGDLHTLHTRDGSASCVRVPEVDQGSVIALSPDGSRAVIAANMSDRTIRTIEADTRTGRRLRTFENDAPQYIADYSPDGSLVALGDTQGGVIVYQPNETHGFEASRGAGLVRWIEFNHAGTRLAAGGNDGSVRLYDLDSSSSAQYPAFENKIWSLAWSPDDRFIAAAGTEGVIKVFDARTGRTIARHLGHETTIDTLVWTSSAGLLSASRDRTMRRWDDPLRPNHPAAHNQGLVQSARWAPDGSSFYVGTSDGSLIEYDAATLAKRRAILRGAYPITSVSLSRDGSLLGVACDDGQCLVLRADNGARVSAFRVKHGRALNLAFAPDGTRVAVASDHNAIVIVDPSTGRELAQFPGVGSNAIRAEYAPDGATLAAAYYDHTIRIHDAATGAIIKTLTGPTNWINPPRFTADGRMIIAGAADGVIYAWDLMSTEPPRTLIGHQGGVYGCSISPDGTRVVSGGWDNTIRLWDLRSGLELLTWRPHIHATWVAEFSPEGERFISGSHDGTILLWDARQAPNTLR